MSGVGGGGFRVLRRVRTPNVATAKQTGQDRAHSGHPQQRSFPSVTARRRQARRTQRREAWDHDNGRPGVLRRKPADVVAPVGITGLSSRGEHSRENEGSWTPSRARVSPHRPLHPHTRDTIERKDSVAVRRTTTDSLLRRDDPAVQDGQLRVLWTRLPDTLAGQVRAGSAGRVPGSAATAASGRSASGPGERVCQPLKIFDGDRQRGMARAAQR